MAVFENKNQLIMIFAAVVIGIVASVLVASYIQGEIKANEDRLVQKFTSDQKKQEKLHNDQMTAMKQTMDQIKVRAEAAEKAAKEAAEKAAKEAAKKEEVVKKKPQSLSIKTPAGKRAITVKIDSLNAVGGMVNPGDVVDIIAHLNIPTRGKATKEDKKETVTAMIFQKLQILAVNTNIDQPGDFDAQQKDGNLRVTLAVNPQEAGLLSFAERNGKLNLTLRGPNENKNVMLSAATWSTLAEYVLENSGADIELMPKIDEPKDEIKADVKDENVEDAKPYIQIYRGGREL